MRREGGRERETVRVEGRGVRQWEKRGREQNERRGDRVKGERRE